MNARRTLAALMGLFCFVNALILVDITLLLASFVIFLGVVLDVALLPSKPRVRDSLTRHQRTLLNIHALEKELFPDLPVEARYVDPSSSDFVQAIDAQPRRSTSAQEFIRKARFPEST